MKTLNVRRMAMYRRRDTDKMGTILIYAFGIITALYLVGYALMECAKILGI